ncbi:MAG: class I SAM-dependent methyltransferase [Bacteroidetes bacterium]|nr:class I SAM-dependent methyltransferase [Bacteroidota bacterium]
MSDPNLNTYNSATVIKWYDHLDALTPIEKYFFELHKDLILRSNILDIGIGGGRTTAYLVSICKNYIGIDYSKGFVETVKTKFPNADIRLIDARDLSAFENNTFDLVNFSFNGIDYVSLDDRKKILSEINRVLKPNGVFFFSTHNKDHTTFDQLPWRNKSNNLITNLKTFIKLLPFLPKHLKQKEKEIRLKEYAIINDSAHNYGLFTFYTSPRFLKEQLNTYHFYDIALFSKNGKIENDETLDDWIFVTCKRSVT